MHAVAHDRVVPVGAETAFLDRVLSAAQGVALFDPADGIDRFVQTRRLAVFDDPVGDHVHRLRDLHQTHIGAGRDRGAPCLIAGAAALKFLGVEGLSLGIDVDRLKLHLLGNGHRRTQGAQRGRRRVQIAQSIRQRCNRCRHGHIKTGLMLCHG